MLDLKIASTASIRESLDWVCAEYERLAYDHSRLEGTAVESTQNHQPGKYKPEKYRELDAQDVDDEIKTEAAEAWKPAPPKLAFACVLPASTENLNVLAVEEQHSIGVSKSLDELPHQALSARGRAVQFIDTVADALGGTSQDAGMHRRRSMPKAIFNDMNDVKNLVKQHLFMKPKYRVEDLYYTSGIFQAIAKNAIFDNFVLLVIVINAFWMAVDTDHNDADMLFDAKPVFIVAEQLFCLVFTTELTVRFMAFARKIDCLRDMWFVFDMSLVVMMVLETWIIAPMLAVSSTNKGGSGMGNASILKLAKMLRLCRMLRVARLMRAMPEFFILTKAIASSARATFFTLSFLAVVLYVYGIVFKQLLDGTPVGTEFFRSVPHAMETLFFQVTIADDIITIVTRLRDESMAAYALLYSVVLIAHITLMNMLIGVLCEGISLVAEKERMSIQVAMVESSLRDILIDETDDDDGVITKDELLRVLQSRQAVLHLEDIGIDVVGLVDAADGIFQSTDEQKDAFSRTLTFEEFMEVLLQLRGSNKATVKDIVDLRKYLNKVLRDVSKLRSETHSTLHKVKCELEAGQTVSGF